MWFELKECIHNMEPHPFKLFITMVEKHADIIDDVMAHFSDAHVEIVENRGFDVGPFIHIINQVNLDDYSYIVKLHTKRDISSKKDKINDLSVYGPIWRDKLLSLFKSKEIFKQYLQAFEKDPKIGMQANHTIIIHHDYYDENAVQGIRQYLKDAHLPIIKYAFVAGTMFIARASVFKDIQNLHLTVTDFPDPKGEHKTQLAHVMERLFGYFVYKNKFVIRDGLLKPETEQKYHRKNYIKMKFVYPIIRFFYQKKTTESGNTIVKICKILVYRRKI